VQDQHGKKDSFVHKAAKYLVESGSDIVAVVPDEGKLVGVVTDWDITRASSDKIPYDTNLRTIMF